MLGGCVSVAEPEERLGAGGEAGRSGAPARRAPPPAATPPRAPPPPALRAPPREGAAAAFSSSWAPAALGVSCGPRWRGCAAGWTPPGTPRLGLAARELCVGPGTAPPSPGRGRRGRRPHLGGATLSSRAPAAPAAQARLHTHLLSPRLSLLRCWRVRSPRGRESPGRPAETRSGGFAGFPGPFCFQRWAPPRQPLHDPTRGPLLDSGTGRGEIAPE